MQPSSRLVVRASLAAILLAAAPAAAAPAPEDLDATYNSASHTLTLTWDYDTTNYAVDEYRVYLDGALLGTSTTQSYDDDLDGWTGVKRTYTVSAVVDDEEYAQSEALEVYLLGDGDVLTPCEVIVIATYDHEPWIAYALHPECLKFASDGE